jgi:hypothetical protein
MSFSNRLNLIINELGYSKNSFAEALGYKNNSVIYDYTREDVKQKQPGFDFFQRFVHAKTGINIEWLLTGEGDKWQKKGTADVKTSLKEKAPDNEELIEGYRRRVYFLEQDVKFRDSIIEALRERLKKTGVGDV